ncbi:hypothetical protein PAMP_023150 [Pampus punctatissimus]
MDRSTTDRNRKQRCGHYNSTPEPQYDVVDNQQNMLNVRIFPARPINEEKEYADRDLPRSASAQSLSSLTTGNSDVFPRCPPREVPFTPGPAVNRNLKPGRRQTRLGNTNKQFRPVVPSGDQVNTGSLHHLHRSSWSYRINCLNYLDSLQKNPLAAERASSKRHHHEWPQTKEDFEQHDFVPMEKRQQDGAFLVRDCSINSNSEPLVLAVYHEKKVYNVKIRFMESTNKYGLGTGQRSNDMFDSVADIIKFHSIFPIILISGRNIPGCKSPENCVLTCPLTKRDVDHLLQ